MLLENYKMKPLIKTVVVACLIFTASSHPEPAAKKLTNQPEPLAEAEPSDPQSRPERCTTCSGGNVNINLKSPNQLLAALQTLPGAEVHTQQSFEGCSSDKGCAGIKVKDGQVVEKFGNANSFKAAADADLANEFTFHAAGTFPNSVFEGGIPNAGPFWWMNENSPFKNGAAAAAGGGGNFEKFSKTSSSFSTSGTGPGAVGGSVDISANPFLNGDFSKYSGGFGAAGADANKAGGFQSSAFESSSFSSSSKGQELDLSKNPFLNGGGKFSQAGFQGYGQSGQAGLSSQAGQSSQGQGQAYQGSNQFAAASQSSQGNGYNKFGAGYSGSSPSPFTASTSGSNLNLIQNSQKNSEFDFEQQQQSQSIDDAFASTGNVGNVGHEHSGSGGELQQTCAGQGYVCVHKAQCNNGVVNTNGAGILQARTKKQYCNTKTEICCRIEISTLAGAGGIQGSLGVGSSTFAGQSGSGSQGGLFATSGQSGQGSAAGSGSSSFGSNSQGSGSAFEGSSGSQNSGSAFGSSAGSQNSGSAFGSSSGTQNSGSGFNSGSQGAFGAGSNTNSASGFGQNGQSGFDTKTSSFESSSSTFNSNRGAGSNFGQGAQGNRGTGTGFGAQGSFGTQGTQSTQGSQSSQGSQNSQGSTGFGATGTFGTGSGSSNGGNRGVTIESSSSSFESSSRGTNFGSGGKNGFGTAPTNTNTRFNANGNTNNNNFNNNEVYKSTSQTNFVDNDSFSSGSDSNSVYRPGAVGSGLKPGVPYLPPVDNSNSGTNVVSSTAFPTTFVTTPRPFNTPKPYVPPTQAPGYLPPVGDSSINTEIRVPGPVYNDGSLILDETRPRPPSPVPAPSDIPAGCAAALKCTPIEFCTAEGVISNTTVVLTRDQEAFRVPLTDCKDLESGRIGKCCRDSLYTDPWPTNQLGKWVQGVFGGNDGKYVADSRGSPNNPRPQITARPPVTGNVILDTFKPTPAPGFNQGFGQKGQYEIRGQGQSEQGGIGVIGVGGQGQYSQGGRGQFTQGSQATQSFSQSSQSSQKGAGQFGQGGRGQLEIQGQGVQGQFGQGQKGFGQAVITGEGQSISQGFGQGVRQGSGYSVTQGSGIRQQQGQVTQGSGIRQGAGIAVSQGSGLAVSQGQGFGLENDYSESVQRVFLQGYSGNGQCGVLNGQKPYGNRNELEVDFAEIPWQAMVLLQTNRSLLCGGVITRPDVVITSASCVDGLDAKNVLIKGGEWKLGIDDEPLPFQIVQVKNILRHPFYKRGSLKYDAAILVLSENLRFSKNIYPICLPAAGETLGAFYNGAGECIVTGWGKQVLQAHLAGSILHSLNVSLINPDECEAKLSQDYPHLLEQYDQDSCACGQPTNPVNNICKVDIGSALACTTGDGHFVLRGVYSWDSGCQLGNQLAAFYKFDLEWYEWAIGLLESARFAQLGGGQTSQNRFRGQYSSSGIKNSQSQFGSGIKGGYSGVKGVKGGFGVAGQGQGQAIGQGQFGSQGQFASGEYSQFSSSSSSKFNQGGAGQSGIGFGFGQNGAGLAVGQNGAGVSFGSGQIKAPLSNSFSATYSEKKVYQSEPKFVTYTTKPEIVTFTTKPEIVTFTTKPEYFTYTTKPKLVTYTTKPQIITYETSGSGTNPQYVAPGVTYNPSFSSLVGKQHTHNAQCKCLENGKK